MARRAPLRRPVRYRLESAAVLALYGFCRWLPLDMASAFGGWAGRSLGALLRRPSGNAHRNLRRHMPDLSQSEVTRVVRAAWEQLGRTAAELPHLDRLDLNDRPGGRIELIGREHLDALARDRRAGLLFSGHIGNWELLPFATRRAGLPMHVVFRAMNNPLVDGLVARMRGAGAESAVAKGSDGARELFKRLKEGGHVGMLVDQRMSDGIAVPFFGEPAMTAPALARFALRFDIPIVPLRCERVHGARFRVTAYPPLEVPRTGDRERDVAALMTEVNAILETWIREHPEQWLWMHRRWPV